MKTKKTAMDTVVFVFTVDNKTIKSYDSDAVSVISLSWTIREYDNRVERFSYMVLEETRRVVHHLQNKIGFVSL